MHQQLSHIGGWSALINGVFAILGAIFLVIFFVKGEPFGTLNDLTTLPWALALLPVLWLFYKLGLDRYKSISIIALIAGIIGLAGVFILQLLLVLKIITVFQQTYYITSAFGVIGVWILIASYVGRNENFIPPALATFGTVLGVAWVLAAVCVLIGGFPPADSISSMSDMSSFNPITLIGISLIFLGYFIQPIWAIWMGRFLLSQT